MNPEQKAASILSELWDGQLPVDPVKIAARMNVPVLVDAALDDSGMLIARDDGGWEIHIAPNEPSYRQRFTIAHELGHLSLGHGSMQREKKSYSIHNYKPMERDANVFAAALLMPRRLVWDCLESGWSMQQMMELFNVSDSAMTIRLERLGVV